MSLIKYFQKKNIRVKRVYISNKLDSEIKKAQEILENRYKRKYKKKKNLSYQSTTDAVADRIRELRQNGDW